MSLNAYKIKSVSFSLWLDSLMISPYPQFAVTPFAGKRKRKVSRNKDAEELPHEELPPEEQRQKLFCASKGIFSITLEREI